MQSPGRRPTYLEIPTMNDKGVLVRLGRRRSVRNADLDWGITHELGYSRLVRTGSFLIDGSKIQEGCRQRVVYARE